MRPELDPEILRSSDLERAEDGARVEVAGLVTARQRPETAKGIVFMLIEDERGSVNLIVPPRVYERHRRAVRAAPLVRATGRLERREGTTNVLVEAVVELERAPRSAPRRQPTPLPPAPARPPRREPPLGAPSRRERELVIAELREVAPAGHSFGRRR
jgi:error-prone DNA polymerase